ncbi:MAG: glycine cleavage system protein GcvH [Alphaproteobacteria bacterium]|nr:glycine cleavage system protein GcvH [Alphaproteobacteria bacterium]
MSEIYYTEDHEWILVEGDIGTCGISEFAQEQLGDIVYVELPEPGKLVAQNDELAVVESVKAASEIYAPVSGEITESNDELVDEPGKINEDAMGDGWFFKIRISDAKELEDLLDKASYEALIAGQH